MSKLYVGDEFKIHLDCKEDVDGQADLWIYYKKPVSNKIGRWLAVGIGDFADYDTVKNVDIDEKGEWEVQPFSDTHDVHGDIIIMPVFPPLIPFLTGKLSGYLEGVAA